MHVIPFELPPPKNEADFERMCAQIYGVIYGDKTPKINGRKGQSQGGIDVFVTAKGIGRIGIQCKKYCLTTLEWKHVEEEVSKADKAGTPIQRMLIATTSQNNAALLKQVQNLSDEREKAGKFGVEIEFWDDIQNRIDSHTILQDSYNPQAVGAAFHRQSEEIARIREFTMEARDGIATLSALSQGREDSTNKLITGQLDRTNDLIKAGRYREALEHVDHIGNDLKPFDDHQKARWYLQRGLCLWLSHDDEREAAALFITASKTYPDDEKMAASGIRGLMLAGDLEGALAAGHEAAKRFPVSLQVWLAFANARMLSGESITLDDTPATFREEPDVLQFAAISARQRGNIGEAAGLAEAAVEHPSAGFFNRAAFLRFAIEDCARDPVLAQFGLVEDQKISRLSRAISYFDDRKEKLWDIQSDAAVETAGHLGFAFLLLRQPSKALEIVAEARAMGVRSTDLLRVEIQALDESGRKDDALIAAKASLNDLPPEAILAACEIAANHGDLDFVETCRRSASEKFPSNEGIADFLLGLRWGALVRCGRKEEAVAEILASVPGIPDKLVTQCAAARLLKWAQRPIEAAEKVDRVAAMVTADTPAPDKLLAAELLSHFERWTEAATLYETLLSSAGRGPSELHAKLLECYVESDSRAKAKALLSGLPEGWADHDETRRCAINLGQKAGDWRFLLPLAERQIAKAPVEAVSWLFLLKVLMHTVEPAAFQAEVGMVPEDVSGSIRNVGMLAALELRYGEASKGLRRLYRLTRRNWDEPEAFSAYLINFLIGKLPPIDASSNPVGPGCSVTVEEQDTGYSETIVIDPEDVGALPKRDGFYSTTDPDVAALFGKVCGDVVEIPMRAGGGKFVRIVATDSAYRHLAALAQEKARSFGGIPHLKSVPVGQTGDAERDLAKMYQEISRSRAISEQILETYASGLMTLSRLAKALGRSPVEICMGWPSDGPPIFVGGGLADERERTLEILRNPNLIVVADSTALCELARHGAECALQAFPKLLVSSGTKELVDALVAEAESDESCGMAFDDGGRLGFVEFGEKRKIERIAFARRMAEIVGRCEVLPAYGDLGESKEAKGLSSIMGAEEKEMLLLAKEHGASILTLDGRIRALAHFVFGIHGIWPQVVVMRALEAGLLAQHEASAFAVGEFLSNRSFVSLRSEDLLWMVSQGDVWLQTGIAAFKRYLASSDTDRDSSFEVTLGFLRGVAHLHTQIGAFGELLSHLAEAMFRRADCPANFGVLLADFVNEILLDAAPDEHVFAPINKKRNRELALRMKLMVQRLDEALIYSKAPPSSRPVRIRVVHCASKPWLMVDRSLPSGGTEEEFGVGKDPSPSLEKHAGKQTSAKRK